MIVHDRVTDEVGTYGTVYTDELFNEGTFTRSDGTLFSRLYERLTKASRRKQFYYNEFEAQNREKAYRRGVLDAFTALRSELT